MAGAVVGGAFLSASLQVLFDRIASHEVVDFIKGKKLNSELLKRLEITLLSVNVVLDDAEEKQIRNKNVKKWLEELKDAVYDAEDLLDEISTESLRCKVEAESQTSLTQVQNFCSSFNPFNKGVNSKLEEVLARLEFIAKQKNVLGLKEGFAEKPLRRLEETSVVDESSVYGRDAEKESIMKLLLSDETSGYDDIGVVTIVGMGGIGKTTLAQLVYNDYRLKEYFSYQAWVCVSEEFDIFRVLKTILEQVTSSATDHIRDLNTLQLKLMEKLAGKKFLIVLDDVWNENYFEWERLRTPFNAAGGSKIIVTTRNESVASVVRTSPINYLNVLSDDDCWLLFARHAFVNGDSRAQSTPETLRREITKGCKGLPLAAKALGGLLRFRSTPKEWDEILTSDIWEFSYFIIPALRISYFHLPSHLEQCFAYCSMFPKDYEFKKEQLIQLWIAENFLHQHDKSKSMEEIGEVSFRALVSRSLFQRSSGNKLSYVMHDLVHDLAKFVSGEFCFWLEANNSHNITGKTRHLGYLQSQDAFQKLEGIYEAKSLRTFLPLNLNLSRRSALYFSLLSKKVLHKLLPMLTCLRVLSLSRYCYITELPDSIGNLKYLRLLDLSFTGIKWLPNSTCKLYNLQRLALTDRKDLIELPANMHNLRNLSHLDLAGTNIKEIPVHVSKLKRLQTLTLFSVGRQRGTGIGELRQLNDLHGKLSILELQNVNGREDALEARLKEKNQLEGLWLEWSINSGDSRKEREVLEKLQPHTNLKELTIKNYGGTAFPFWLVERSSLSNIVCLCLSNCKYCISLPPLGQLHSLKDLSITGFYAVETIGPEFYGSDGLATKPFESLQTLRFKEMVEWEEWFPFENDIEGRAFPCLQELYVENCPKLTKHLPSNLPCLTKLVVSDCQELVASLPRAPDILHLQLGYCDKFLLKNLPPQLKMISFEGWSLSERIEEVDASLKILNIYDCLSLSWLPMDRLSTTLEVLEIKSSDNLKFPVHLYYDSLEKLLIESSCCSLQNFPLDIFPKLKHLTIKNCTSMESISVPCRPQYDLQSLRHLHIFGCPKFVSFPEGGLHAPNLSYFRIDLCKHLKSLPQRMHTHIPSLEVLTIISCPEIVSFPKGGLPSNLRSLCIYGCARLYANRAEWHLQRLTCLGDFCISCEDIKSLPEEGLLPTTLATLRLAGCPHLKSLNRKGLNELTNLEILLIDDCPELECLPEEGLPKYLSHFRISECPLLKRRCKDERGGDWPKISHVPCIRIDDDIVP